MKYFKITEFDSPDVKGSGSNMNTSFLNKLDAARGDAGISFLITSGYRTAAHNAKLKDSVSNSAHTKGLAADISASTDKIKQTIINSLVKVGFGRIGVGRNYIHVDDDVSKPMPAVWTYPDTAKAWVDLKPTLLSAIKKKAPIVVV